ncbi:hypothetical protein, partial [Serratia marcescens]|uniref:hypothetical protein n=1 Tax=Serratia marcescens TaxID=615 RepID=UPI00281292E4
PVNAPPGAGFPGYAQPLAFSSYRFLNSLNAMRQAAHAVNLAVSFPLAACHPVVIFKPLEIYP